MLFRRKEPQEAASPLDTEAPTHNGDRYSAEAMPKESWEYGRYSVYSIDTRKPGTEPRADPPDEELLRGEAVVSLVTEFDGDNWRAISAPRVSPIEWAVNKCLEFGVIEWCRSCLISNPVEEEWAEITYVVSGPDLEETLVRNAINDYVGLCMKPDLEDVTIGVALNEDIQILRITERGKWLRDKLASGEYAARQVPFLFTFPSKYPPVAVRTRFTQGHGDSRLDFRTSWKPTNVSTSDQTTVRYSPWIDTTQFVELMKMNAMSGSSDTNIRRYKGKWDAVPQPGSGSRRFKFDLAKLRANGIKYPPDWDSISEDQTIDP